MAKSRYWIFYVTFAAVIAVLAVVYFVLVHGVSVPLPETLFMDGAVTEADEGVVVYLAGENVTARTKNHRSRPVTKDTHITGKMTIRTGFDSSVAFWLKSAGFIHIYPDSVVYISEAGRFAGDGTAERNYGRFSEVVIESGKIFCGVNTYSDNSQVRVRTSTADLVASKGNFFTECENDFVTKVTCIDGEVRFRPAAVKFGTERGHSKNDNSSIQRFISHRNRLSSGEYVILTHKMSEEFDSLIDKVYHSSFFPNIDKQTLTDALTIKPLPLDPTKIPETPYYLYHNSEER